MLTKFPSVSEVSGGASRTNRVASAEYGVKTWIRQRQRLAPSLHSFALIIAKLA
ncbi:hypothetical protein V3C99_011245 [Haemonchus contortus]